MTTEPTLVEGPVRLEPATIDICDGAYYDWMQNPEVLRYLEARFSDRSPAGLRVFVEACQRAPHQHLFAIRLNTDDAHVGNIKLQVDPHHKRGDIGIVIGLAAQRGRGIGTAAIRAICRYGFGPLGLAKLTAGCYAPNEASLRAFQNAGFVVEANRPAHFVCDGRRVNGIFMGCLPGGDK